jgi:crotonobetainyl-CoA:carnitine CoA-transferase CaiB-like acyl-CoA transferase
VVSLCETKDLAEAVESDALRELVGRNRYEERDAFAEALSQATAKFSTAELEERFDRHNVWWAPVNYYDDLLSDPQLMHSEVFREVDVRGRKIHLVNHPNRYDGKVPELRVLALDIGEHTREILAEHGFTSSEVEQLFASKAVTAPDAEQPAKGAA